MILSSARVNLTVAGTAMMTNKYQYNAVDNILGITNAIDPTRDNTNGDKKLGGAFKHSYAYDDLNHLGSTNVVKLSMCWHELYFKNLGNNRF
ncbi:MAG: hypothetical protein HXO24_05050 [Prevotella sp.]|nr:hypothetical protein [Prevotella sp.]